MEQKQNAPHSSFFPTLQESIEQLKADAPPEVHKDTYMDMLVFNLHPDSPMPNELRHNSIASYKYIRNLLNSLREVNPA